MFSASKTVAVLVALAGFVSAAPITPTVTKSAPASYATGYLEEYKVYHTRYLALDCKSHRNGTLVDDFFEDCCRPLLKTEDLQTARASYCIPSNSSLSSASSVEAVATSTDSAAVSEYSADATSTYLGVQATTTAASVVEALVASTSETPSSTYVEPTSTYVAPSSTYVAPAPAATTAASSGGSWNGDAHATYYLQGGNAGACGNYNSDSSYIIALPYSWYGGNGGSPSQYCGRSVEIQRLSNGATVTATVADLCPSCTTSNSLDLSVGAFTAIASESEGQVDIKWKFV